jgi:hypothetical protein
VPLTLKALAGYIGIPVEELVSAGITEYTQNGGAAVRVPYRDPDGSIVFHRWRDSLDGHWIQPEGVSPIPFGLDRLAAAREAGSVAAVEGETDTLWLWYNGITAIGIPGANNWKDEWSTYLDGIDTIHVVQENDKGGEMFVRRLRESAIAERCRRVRLPDGIKDVLELGKRNPDGFAEAWEECIEQAGPLYVPRIRWLDTEGLAQLPEPSWLIHEVLPAGGLSQLYGQPDHGKTFVSIDMSLCIATGTPWHGHDVQHATTAYVIGEGQNWILQRIDAWKAQNEWMEPLDAFFTVDRLSLMDIKDVDDMIHGLKSLPPVGLVVLDTLNRTMGTGDESKTQDMTIYVRGCDEIRERLGCHVMVVHHSGWDGSRERGSSVLRGAADTVISVARVDEKVYVSPVRQRNGPPFEKLAFQLVSRLESKALQRIEMPNKFALETRGETEGFENRRRVAEAVALDLYPKGALATDVMSLTGLSKATVYRIFKALIEQELLDTKSAPRYKLTERGKRWLDEP